MSKPDLAARFSSLFTPGTVRGVRKQPWPVAVSPIGQLHLPSGRIVVSDVTTADETEAMSRAVRPGVYAVEASLVTVDDQVLVAAVRVVFSQQSVARWESTDEGDAAVSAVIVDLDVLPAFTRYCDDADQAWWDALDSDPYRCFAPDAARPETCVLFRGGDGNSLSEAHWGLDANGEPVVLVCDCNVVP